MAHENGLRSWKVVLGILLSFAGSTASMADSLSEQSAEMISIGLVSCHTKEGCPVLKALINRQVRLVDLDTSQVDQLQNELNSIKSGIKDVGHSVI